MRLHKLANNGRAAPLHEKTVDGSNEPSQHLRSEGHTRSSSKLKLRGSETTRVADVLAELRLTPRNQRQVLAMGCLAVFAIFIYFSAPWFAEYWRFDIGTIINALEPAIGQPSRGPLKTAPQIAPKAAAAPQMARIARGAKVRANPGTWGEIISTLPRGVRVAVIETRGNWALIKADGAVRTGKVSHWLAGCLSRSCAVRRENSLGALADEPTDLLRLSQIPFRPIGITFAPSTGVMQYAAHAFMSFRHFSNRSPRHT